MNLAPSHRTVFVRRSTFVAAALLSALCGCFGGKGADHYTRLFRPVLPPSAARRASDPAKAPLPILVRRVYGASHLTEFIEWQESDIEFGHYEDLRWIESPARMIERALYSELFETRGIPLGGGGDEIEVELLAFEQAHDPALHAVVALEVTRSGKRGDAVRRFEESEPLTDDSPETLARGIGLAMRRVIDAAADWIENPAGAKATSP